MILDLIGLALPIINRVIPDPVAAAKVQADLTIAMMQQSKSLTDSMAEVMKADSQSESWLTRSMRPIVCGWGIGMVSFVGIVAPAFGIQDEVVAGLRGVPEELWTLVTVPIGVWMAGRTLEKAVKGK